MAYNLDFSGWKAGNTALAKGTVESKTTKAKAKAAQMSGLTSGIGTLIGAAFGGPLGASIGASLGGAASGSGELDSGVFDKWGDAFGGRSGTNRAGTPFGGASNDLMQLASSYNMIDESGNISPSFLRLLKDIGTTAA